MLRKRYTADEITVVLHRVWLAAQVRQCRR